MMSLDPAEIMERFPEKSPIFMLGMKRRVYWTAQIVFAGFCGLFLFLGYNDIFRNNFTVTVPIFLLIGSLF